ncbi:MAG: DUF177 domain-containing protein [Acidobacteria bacterium]|nr:MAG: DUF177 domain-containing protein [Acidobacteriota bacterium]MCL4287149.1 DUF177 domain-containing protein [Thermoleophilia bacterium]
MVERPIDLDALALRSGAAERIELDLEPEPPAAGGGGLTLGSTPVAARIDVSRTSSGWALRLRAGVVVLAECARCLGPARLELEIDVREVEQGEADDPDLRSPYVADGLLEPARWLRDAIVLALPDRVLCREDCAGLCAVCGVSLNEVDPATHVHDPEPDPRFAKLRDLLG